MVLENFGKTEHSNRVITISSRTKEMLLQHRLMQVAQAEKLGVPRTRLMFPNNVGGYMSYNNFRNRYVRPYLALAGLDTSLTSHSFRHIGASMSLMLGCPLPTIASMLGHANVSTTLAHYSHAIPNSQDLVVKALESVMILE